MVHAKFLFGAQSYSDHRGCEFCSPKFIHINPAMSTMTVSQILINNAFKMMGEFVSSEYYVVTTRPHYIQVCDRGEWLWF